jgi:DNA invertase Pin-like site-specific DNA recombinase
MKKNIVTNTNNKNCFIYIRVSTKRQADEGYSLEAQLKACTEYAEKLGFTIKDTFIEKGESATVADRTEFKRMLEQCEDGSVSAIIVFNTDRFARNEADHFLVKSRLKMLGVSLYSASQPMISGDGAEAQLVDTIMAGINAFYSRDNSRKTKKGMREKFEQGIWPTKAPLGYKNIIDPTTEKRIIGLNPDQDYLVKEAFEEFAKGKYSIHSLCSRMAKRGLKGKTGIPIGVSTLHILLTNTFYYGLMKWGGMERMGTHKTLITKELFDKVQYLLSKHRSFVIRDRKHDFLLRGAIICSKHNRRLVGEWHKVNSVKRDKIGYYHCSVRGGCKGTYTETEKLEVYVANQFKKLHFTDEFMNEVVNQAKQYLSNIQNSFRSRKQGFDNKMKALEEKRTEVENLLADKVISRE